MGSLLVMNLYGYDGYYEGSEGCGNCGCDYAYECTPLQLGLRHIEGRGIGYREGYTTVDAFLAPCDPLWDCWLPFLDVRAHVFNNGKPAANAGLGLRYLSSRIWGVNTFYDYRRTKHHDYNQVSVGLESLGCDWDFRINGYFPVGSKKSGFRHLEFAGFEGHTLFLTRRREVALKGFNAEFGTFANFWSCFPIYFAGGPYYLNGEGKSTWGGEGRVNFTFADYFSIEVNTSYDGLFKWIGQGQFCINIPFGPTCDSCQTTCCCETDWILRHSERSRVYRHEIIAVDRKRKTSPAIDPLTGLPYVFWFVDNTSHSAGTFESPFSTLAAAEAASQTHDVIYVFPGDRTTTGMDAGIILQDYQRLWGTSVTQSLPTTFGTVTIPSLSSGDLVYPDIDIAFGIALVPQITSTTGDVVTVANNNEISGFYIQNLVGHGITSGSSVTNLNVLKNIIEGPNSTTTNKNEINLVNVQGTLLIDGNLIYPTGSSTNTTNSGIVINSTNIQDANYIISNNDAPAAFNFLVATYTDCANISTTISDNEFTVYGYGTELIVNNATAQSANTFNITNNTFYGDSGVNFSSTTPITSCVFLTLSNEANVNANVTNNTIFTPDSCGFLANLTENSKLNINIENNAFSTWESSIVINLGNPSNLQGYQPTLTASISNNELLFDQTLGVLGGYNVLGGINVLAFDNASISNLSIVNNDLAGVMQNSGFETDNIYIETNQTARVTATISNNGIQAGTNGIVLITNESSVLTTTVTDNLFTHLQVYGLNFTTNSSSKGTWIVDGNTIVAAPAGAMQAIANGTSTTNLTLINNTAQPVQLPSGTGAYQFTNNAATFILDQSGNIGKISGP